MLTEEERETEIKIQLAVADFKERYVKEMRIPDGVEGVSMEVYSISDKGEIYMLLYMDEIIGSILRYNDEITVTEYFNMNRRRVLN